MLEISGAIFYAYLPQQLNSSFAVMVGGGVPYEMYQIVAHSRAPVNSDKRFNTHSQ